MNKVKKNMQTAYIPDIPEWIGDIRKLILGAAVASLFGFIGILATDHFTTVSHATEIRELHENKADYKDLQRVEGKIDLLLNNFKLEYQD